MSEQWLDILNQGTTDDDRDSNYCDACVGIQTAADDEVTDHRCDVCVGIQTAADDEVTDHRCDVCKRPLSAASLWIEAHRDSLSQEQVAAVTQALFPEFRKEYRVRYYSVVLEEGITTGLMTKAQAEHLAGSMYGKVIREGE